MLILTRRPAETIYIGEEVTVTVLGVVGNQVRFGIDAPRSIVIDRAEIHERKKRAAQLANGNLVPEDEPAPDEINGNVERNSHPLGEIRGELRPRLSMSASSSKTAEINGNQERAPETGRVEVRHETEVNGNVAFKRR